MTEFIQNLIGNDLLATIIMSFVPLIELKGGIIFARGVGFSFFEALGLTYLGSTAVFFPIFFLLVPILNLLKKIKWFNAFATKVECYFQDKATEIIEERKKKHGDSKLSETLLKQLGVFIFVAIPLPMTGIWTGTAIAVFLGLSFKKAILPAVVGNLVAGLIISGISAMCMAIWDFATAKLVLDGILYALFAIALVLLIVFIIKVAKKKKKEPTIENGEEVE